MRHRCYRRALLPSLLSLSLGVGSLAACRVELDPQQETQTDACPDERPVRCGDSSCASATDLCPDVTAGELAGEIVDLSPSTLLAHAPEPVTLKLAVEDAERVQALVDDGASWRVELRGESGTYSVEADAAPVSADVRAGRHAGQPAHDFLVTFTPKAGDGPALSAVAVELVTADQPHRFGEARLRFRGDASTLDFEGREVVALEGTIATERVWSHDLDGDGLEDLVALDVQGDDEAAPGEPVLRVFNCDAERCEPAGTAAIKGEELLTPDMLTPDAHSGFLAATVSARTPEDIVAEVEVLYLELSDGEGDAPVLREERATIDVAAATAGARLHEESLEPRLLRNPDTEAILPGLLLTMSAQSAGTPVWSTVQLSAEGTYGKFAEPREFQGLSGEQAYAALGGEISTCLAAGTIQEDMGATPDGALLSTFELDGNAMVAAGPIDPSQGPMQAFGVAEFFDAQRFGALGGASCRHKDLDGDGVQDLVVALESKPLAGRHAARRRATSERRATLLFLKGIEQANATRRLGPPVTLVEGIDAEGWALFGKEGSTFLRASFPLRDPRTGAPIQQLIAPEFTLAADAEGIVHASLVATPTTPRGPAVASVTRADSPAVLLRSHGGNDRVVRKKPGRTTYQINLGDNGGGNLTESRQILAPAGNWILGDFTGGVSAGADGEALLQPTASTTILGWLSSTTGDFLPLSASSDDEGIGGLSDLVLVKSDDGASRIFAFDLQTDDGGAPTEVRVQELAMEDDTPAIVATRMVTVDFSGFDAPQKKVVKFKAGAELSKAVNIAAPDGDGSGGGDCDDADASAHPSGRCMAPTDVLLAFELASGEVVTGWVDVDADDDGLSDVTETPLRADLDAALGPEGGEERLGLTIVLEVEDLGAGPVAILRGIHQADGKTTEYISPRGTHPALTISEPGHTLHLADVRGAGHGQLVACKSADGSVTCQTSGADGTTRSEPLSMVGEAISAVIDLDGDGCADLLSDAGEWLSSRCDGEFDAARDLGPWSAHLFGGDGASTPYRATDYNSSRSNTTSSAAEGPVALPFFDTLELPTW